MDMSSENVPFMISYINDPQAVERNNSRIAIKRNEISTGALRPMMSIWVSKHTEQAEATLFFMA